MRIREIVAAKPSQGVVTVSPQATVKDLLALLAENNVGALVVSSDGSSVEGIVSERDVVRRLHDTPRSEERRVGKECRSQWWPYHQRKRLGDRGPELLQRCVSFATAP